MSYKRTYWKNGETPLNAQNLNNIEDGIEEAKQFMNQDKEDLESLKGLAVQLAGESLKDNLIITYQNIKEDDLKGSGSISIINNESDDLTNGIIRTHGTASVFSGWSGYIGKFKGSFDTVKVPGMLADTNNTSSKYAPTKVRIDIRAVPTFGEISDGWQDTIGLSYDNYPANKPWKEVVSIIKPLDKPLTHSWQWITVKLDEPVILEEETMLWLSYNYNTVTSALFLEVTGTDSKDDSLQGSNINKEKYPMKYNPFIYYGTQKASAPPIDDIKECRQKLSQSEPVYMNCRRLFMVPVILGYVDTKKIYYDIDVNKGGQFYEQVEKVINNMGGLPEDEKVKEVEIMLAKEYDLVQGDTFQLFFRSVIKCYGDYHRFGVNCICSKGSFYPDYFEYTPDTTSSGSITLKIRLRDLKGKFIDEQTTILNIHPVPKLTSPTVKNMCVFGDSLTSSGAWAAEGIRRLVGTAESGFSGPASLKVANLTLNTYGHKTNTINSQIIKHEGYGGWTWQSFLDDSRTSSATDNALIVTTNISHNYQIDTVQKSTWVDNNGLNWELEDLPSNTTIKFNRGVDNNKPSNQVTLPTSMKCDSLSLNISVAKSDWESGNPFFNTTTDKVDFKYWCGEVGCPQIDIAACLLTWNGGGAAGNSEGYTYSSKIDNHMDKAKQLLRQLHSDYPNAKIICMGIQISSLNGGTGANYGATGAYSDMWGTAFYAWDYNKALEELCLSSEFKPYCHYVDTKGQFDTLNNMPQKEVPLNARNGNTYIIGTNGVHPDMKGYYQIGDAFFRKLVSILN